MKMTFKKASDPAYWKKINPELTITEQGVKRSSPPLPLDVAFLDPIWRPHLIEEGYLQFDDVIPPAEVARMRSGLKRLHQNSHLPVFAFLYDEYWNFFQSLNQLLKPVLGNEFFMLPDFWAWCVDPAKKDSGWGPHRDKKGDTLLEDGMPKSVTVWVALSESTPLNGCMYIVPANQDRDYNNFTPIQRPLVPQTTRALCAPSGSIFLWNQRVLHWGGQSSDRSKSPRISMAFEFQRGDTQAYHEPLLDTESLPSFSDRLDLIGRQILNYQHMFNPPADLLETAKQMTSFP